MQLKMLVLMPSELASLPKMPPFRWQIHHVAEIFVALLPPKFELDGSSKVQVTCGPRGAEPLYERMLGVTSYYDEEFDFAKFGTCSPVDRDQFTISTIEKSLVRIAELAKQGTEVVQVIHDTCNAVRACDFSLKIHIKRLSRPISRRNKNGRIIANVYRCLNRDDSDAWCVEIATSSGSVVHTEWLTKRPNHLNMVDHFRKSIWKDEVFVVYDSLGKVVFQLDISTIGG